MSEDIKTISITEILQTVQSSCDFGFVTDYTAAAGNDDEDDARTRFWLDVIRNKSSDTGFGHLVESILRDGFTTAIGWVHETKYISEGHHRLVAAILLGMDEIPYTPYGIHHRYNAPDYICAHGNDIEPYPIEV